MAKAVKARVKMQLAGGAATPAPPVGSSLGPLGVNSMEFVKQFNARTADKRGETVPVVVTVYVDRTFEFILKTAPASEMIRKRAHVAKGSPKCHVQKVGKISWSDIEEIAKIKMQDLNATDVEHAKTMIAGTARSMGIDVV
jgi:large subunit ribosomal protein L11